MFSHAVGVIGLSISDAEIITPRLLSDCILERANHEERIQRMEYERMRWLGFTMIQPHLKKGSRMTVYDLIPFPWDKRPQVLTPDVINRIQQQAARHGRKIKAQ